MDADFLPRDRARLEEVRVFLTEQLRQRPAGTSDTVATVLRGMLAAVNRRLRTAMPEYVKSPPRIAGTGAPDSGAVHVRGCWALEGGQEITPDEARALLDSPRWRDCPACHPGDQLRGHPAPPGCATA